METRMVRSCSGQGNFLATDWTTGVASDIELYNLLLKIRGCFPKAGRMNE